MPWFYGYTRMTRKFSRSSIFQTHQKRAAWGWWPVQYPRGVARHTIAISDLLLKKEVRGSCSAYFVRVHSHGGTWVEPSAVRVQDCRVAL